MQLNSPAYCDYLLHFLFILSMCVILLVFLFSFTFHFCILSLSFCFAALFVSIPVVSIRAFSTRYSLLATRHSSLVTRLACIFSVALALSLSFSLSRSVVRSLLLGSDLNVEQPWLSLATNATSAFLANIVTITVTFCT